MATTVIIGTARIDESVLYKQGHLVHRWTEDVRRDLAAAIRTAAPVNKRANKSNHPTTFGGPGRPVGWLKSQIRGEGISRTARTRLQFAVNSKAGYTQAVLRGTAGGTKAGGGARRDAAGRFSRGSRSGAEFYLLPFNGPKRGAQKVTRFKGQKPNDFFSKGFNLAAQKHPALRG